MDNDNAPTRTASPPAAKAATPTQGGTVEPGNRAAVAKELFQTPTEVQGERYELRDPFAEVTYRSNSLNDMVAKAEQLGISRFVAVDEAGKRTPLQKVGSDWQRPSAPERPTDAQPARDDTRIAPRPTAKPDIPTARDTTTAQRIASIDANAERAATVAQLEATLKERYVIKRAPVTVGDLTIGRTEYRFRGDTSRVAFTESTFRLATDTNSPSVARSMVDVAQARNWQAVRVSGNEDFKRMVWLEASVRGVKTVGYEPNLGDVELLKKEREARLVNRIEPDRSGKGDSTGVAAVPTDKTSARGGGGSKTVLAAIEAVLVAKGVPDKQREAVMAAATEKLALRLAAGQAPKVKVYDKAAPSQRPVVVQTPEVQRIRERAAPAR